MFKKLILVFLAVGITPAIAFNPLDLLKSEAEKSWISFYQQHCPDMADVSDLEGYEAYCSGIDLSQIELPTGYIEKAKSVSFASSNLTSVSHLSGLVEVDDYLNLYNNSIQSLVGLETLKKAKLIDLRGNPDLKTLEGLNNLVELGSIELSGTGVRNNYGLDSLEKVDTLKISNFNPAFTPNLVSGKLIVEDYYGSAPDSPFCESLEDEDILINPSKTAYQNGEFNLNSVAFQQLCVAEEAVEEQTVVQEVDAEIQALPEFQAYLKFSDLYGGPKLFAGGRN